MCETGASSAEIRWLERYAEVAQFKIESLAYVPLLMSLPLLGECSDVFVRQLTTMRPHIWDVAAKHAVVNDPAWALPCTKTEMLKRCAGRAQADADALWAAINVAKMPHVKAPA